jgi:hypothetical protein
LTLAVGVATIRRRMISPWYVLLAGIGGGIVNSLLVERNRLILPSLRRDGGVLHLDLGFLSNVAIGVAAAFLPYLFGIEISCTRSVRLRAPHKPLPCATRFALRSSFPLGLRMDREG